MSDQSILDREISPFRQVGVVLVATVFFMIFSNLIPTAPYSKSAHIMPWVILCGMILFFALANSVLGFGAKDTNKYWLHSIISFSMMLVIGGIMAWAISGVSIRDAGSVRWIYVVLTFGYLVFLSIVNLIRFLVVLAKKHENKLRE
ncbi:MAG: hypothetical protein IPO37_05920 [Saprospiraceae bacterium]|nr:hypothetical protein [Saprospiraceae bacterium]